jgi:hypothetical protein
MRARCRLACEELEARALLAVVPGTDYVLSGFRWPNPSHITFSFPPDGVQWDHGINNLNATFNARFGPGVWERPIALALATWESVANINIAEVPDSPLPYNTIGQAQGDPRFGDIRIAGYPFLNDSTTLAHTYPPPPNGVTAAGDVAINTSMNFNIGSDYDLFSVLLHETGLALGLGEPPGPNEVMDTIYGGVRKGLQSGDLAGIQAIYGPRVPDSFQQAGQGLSPSTAVDLTALLNSAHQATLTNTSLATIGDTEYFSVVAPNIPGASLQATALAANVSLLSPEVTLYDTSGHVLDREGNPSAYGENVSAQVGTITPGARYILAVSGATSDAFAVGAYQLQVAFTGGTPPPAPAPTPTPTPTPTPVPAIPSAPVVSLPSPTNSTLALARPLGVVTSVSLGSLALNAPSDVAFFAFQSARAGVYQVAAPGAVIHILNRSGKVLTAGFGQMRVAATRANLAIYVEIAPAGGVALPGATLSIALPSARALPAHVAVPRPTRLPRPRPVPRGRK